MLLLTRWQVSLGTLTTDENDTGPAPCDQCATAVYRAQLMKCPTAHFTLLQLSQESSTQAHTT